MRLYLGHRNKMDPGDKMSKVHLAANKGVNGDQVYAICASKSLGDGQCKKNNRDTYINMSSPILKPSEYKKIPLVDRCAHCEQIGLERRNAQRKQKGLPPVETFDQPG
jgi:hypothetical protein